MKNANRFLIFDAYGTLVELDDFYGRLQNGFAQHGITLPLEVVTSAAHQEMKHYIAHSVQARDRENWLAVRRECAAILADAVRKQGYEVPISPAGVLQVLGDAIVFRTFPETVEVLETLHERGVPMGVLSNWDYTLGDTFAEMDLARFFHCILSSSQVGVEKPAPEIFHAGLEQARRSTPGLEAQHCFYVGDHYEKDMVPSCSAGMTPVWLVRDRRDLASGETHHTADTGVLRISNLRELLLIVS